MAKKEHHLLRFLMPLFSCIYGLGAAFLCALPLRSEGFVLHEAMLSDLLTILVILFTLWLIRKPLTKLFPQISRYGFQRPKGHVLWLIALTMPLFVLLSHYALYAIASSMGQVSLHPFTDYAPGEIWQDLYRTLGAVLLVPLLEELCFRMMALSPIKRRGRQLVCALLVSVFFGLLHTTNLILVTFHGIVFSLLFLLTGQILYSVFSHACLNLTATLLGVLDHCGVWRIRQSDFPTILLVETPWAWGVVAALALTGILVFAAGIRKEPSQAETARNT